MARKKSFDPAETMAAMVEVFWDKGYTGTSLADLEAATGLDRKSLYNTFGVKKEIFNAALTAYLDERNQNHGAVLLRDPKGIQNIRDFFLGMVSQASPRGCLLTKTLNEAELIDADSRSIAEHAISGLEQLIQSNLIPSFGQSATMKRLAAFLTSSIQGLTTMAKVNPDPKRLKPIVETVLSVLDDP